MMVTGRIQMFKFRILFYLSVCDLLTSCSFVIGRYFFLSKVKEPGCEVMAYFMQYGSLASFVWTATLAYTLQRAIMKMTWEITALREFIFNALGWLIPIIPLILMKTENLVGDALLYCWIKDVNLYRFYFLYFPFTAMFIFNLVCFIRTLTNKKRMLKLMKVSYIETSSDTINSINETIVLIRTILCIQTV